MPFLPHALEEGVHSKEAGKRQIVDAVVSLEEDPVVMSMPNGEGML